MAATLSHNESRRLYSWWWNSHISPKNSKWLQENLADMDSKIKAMIKIIEEDADSFAKRAEMYYRRRPELMNLVEEFYRAFRALAERYDHATGALRQAHRTMAEAFPDQISLELDDDFPPRAEATEAAMHDSYMSQTFNHVDLQNHNRGVVAGGEEFAALNLVESRRKVSSCQEANSKDSENEMLQKEISRVIDENQHLKSQIEHGNKAESEVSSLKETLSKLESEKDAALHQWQQSSKRLSSLRSEISHTQEEFNKLKDEMQMGLKSLNSAKDRCVLLENSKQCLQLELDKLKKRAGEQQEELNKKRAELESFGISIQEEQLRSIQAEMARLSLEKQLAESQEKMRLLSMEVQVTQIEKDQLQREIEKIKEEKRRLDDQNRSSSLRVVSLQNQILSLKDVLIKHEYEVSLHIKERKALQDEISLLKEDKNDLQRRHNSLSMQIQAANLNFESLQAVVHELRDHNFEMKEIAKNHDDLKSLQAENLKQLEKMSERNVDLEKSLSVANIESDGLKKKKKALDDLCNYLSSKVSNLQSEQALLVSRTEAISQKMEKLMAKNLLLENSLSDANVELESLRAKLKDLEESCQSLHNQNSTLRAEKRALISEIESIVETLGNLGSRYVELEDKHSALLKEKDSILIQVTELWELINVEREEHTNTVHSNKSMLFTLEKQICLLQEEGLCREEKLEEEQHKMLGAQIEIFILQRCLCDVKEKNSVLTTELQKKSSIQEEKIGSLSQHNEKLVRGFFSILKALKLDHKYETLDGVKDDIILHLILHEIKCLLNTITDAQDVKQNQLLEKSLVVTLLDHFGREVADLRLERNSLKNDSQIKAEELSVLQSEKHNLLKINKQFCQEMQASKAEVKFLAGQLSDLRESRHSLQNEIIKLIDENSSLSIKLHDVSEKEKAFEEEYSDAILAEATTQDYLSLIFRNLCYEKSSELQLLNQKTGALEIKNNNLKQSIAKLEDDLNTAQNGCTQLKLQIDTGKKLLVQKSKKLSLDKKKLQLAQDINLDLCRDFDEAKAARDDLEKKLIILSESNKNREIEITCLREANQLLTEEVKLLRSKESDLTGEHEMAINVRSCSAEITTLLNNIQIAVINAAVFKEKVLELIITCESFEISSMVQREVLKEEIVQRNSFVDELKEKLNAVEAENRRFKVDLNGDFSLLGSLQSEVTTLENQTFSLAKDRLLPTKQKKEDSTLMSVQHFISSSVTEAATSIELQKLHTSVKTLQKVVMDTGVVLEQERLDFTRRLADASNQIEILQLKETLDNNSSELNYNQMLKDIQLDLVQSSSHYGNGIQSFRLRERRKDSEISDQTFEFWGVVGLNSNNHMHGDIGHPRIEAVEDDKGKCPSTESMMVKELGVDKQALLSNVTVECHQEWRKKTIQRLSSDAQRLSLLQCSIQELKANIESSEGQELDSVKVQLRESEAAILQLVETTNKLAKKAEEFALSSNVLPGENIDASYKSQRKISERAQKLSERIGRLELELQKIQHVLAKLEEERVNRRSKAMQRRSKVIVDYLYGRSRDSRKQRRAPTCGCMRTKTEDD